MSARVALLLDGGFVRVKLKGLLGRFPTAEDVVDLTRRIMAHDRLKGLELFRIYFYDAPPHSGRARNPLDHSIYDFDRHPAHQDNQVLQDTLGLKPDVAMRRGELSLTGWKLRRETLDELRLKSRTLTAHDLAPDLKQKGVDLRVGLDVAWLSVKRIVDIVVLVTADSDFVPAMKFSRREGLKVYLDTMGHGVWRDLRLHSDYVFNSSAGSASNRIRPRLG